MSSARLSLADRSGSRDASDHGHPGLGDIEATRRGAIPTRGQVDVMGGAVPGRQYRQLTKPWGSAAFGDGYWKASCCRVFGMLNLLPSTANMRWLCQRATVAETGCWLRWCEKLRPTTGPGVTAPTQWISQNGRGAQRWGANHSTARTDGSPDRGFGSSAILTGPE